jgi:hypothetical protein
MALFRPLHAWLLRATSNDVNARREPTVTLKGTMAASGHGGSSRPRCSTTCSRLGLLTFGHGRGSPGAAKSCGVLCVSLTLLACAPDVCSGDCALTTDTLDTAGRDAASQTTATSQGANVPDASVLGPELFSCRSDVDCVATPFPACSQHLRQCVGCTSDLHCDAQKPHCAVLASDELNKCVECQSGVECASGLCMEDTCLECDPESNAGCVTGTCTEGEAPHCVACVDDDDCTSGLCIANQCRTCDVRSNEGCAEDRICVPLLETQTGSELDAGADASPNSRPDTQQSDGVCVECAPTKPCAVPALPRCLNNTCVACEPNAVTNNGCPQTAPFCLQDTAIVDAGPKPDTANRCVECLASSDCNDAQCVDHTCQPCNPDTNAGCEGDDVCAPRESGNVSAAVAYVCLECNNEKACDVGYCGQDGRCH